MPKIPMTMACGPYDRMQALQSGEVAPDGIDLRYIPIQSPPEIFARMIKTRSFDIAEMSAVHYMVMRAHNALPFVAIPVFPSRLFRHGYIFVNEKAGIHTPKDLEGRRVGIQEYRMTAALWIRGILTHEYGVDCETFEWFEGGVNTPRPPDETMDLRPRKKPSLRIIPAGKHLSDMLAHGEIDAYLGSRIPDSLHTSSEVSRLFPDFRVRERAYFRKTGIFPIMHTLVVREDLLEEHPWIAKSLFEACSAAKRVALERMHEAEAPPYMLPWAAALAEEVDLLFGGDPWPYGIEANRPTLDAMARYLLEQHFLAQPIAIEAMFASVTDAG